MSRKSKKKLQAEIERIARAVVDERMAEVARAAQLLGTRIGIG